MTERQDRHEAGAKKPPRSHDETLKKIMDDAAKEYRKSKEYKLQCLRMGSYTLAGMIVAGLVVGGINHFYDQYEHEKRAAQDRLKATAVVDVLGSPDALRALNLTSLELKTVAQQEAANAETAHGPLRDGYNSFSWLLRNAAASAKATNSPALTPVSYEQIVNGSIVSITALDVLAPSSQVITDIGRPEMETPTSAR